MQSFTFKRLIERVMHENKNINNRDKCMKTKRAYKRHMKTMAFLHD